MSWLEETLGRVSGVRVAVFGDFCVDAYWEIEGEMGEVSVETGLPVHRVRRQRYGLGGAGNVAANVVDLGVKECHAVGLIGADMFGQQMVSLLKERRVETKGLLACQGDWQTLVYAKPCVGDRELNRVDFGGFNAIGEGAMAALEAELDRAAGRVDVVILNQQLPAGVSTAGMIERINGVVERHANCLFVVDARHRPELYRGVVLKLNAHEASRVLGEAVALEQRISAGRARGFAERLSARTGKAVFVTRGENGIVGASGGEVFEVPGIQIIERTDPVGAGDTAVAALAVVLGSGGNVVTAAKVANIAASVTVRKLQTTGTATPAETLGVGATPDYVYLPELADDPRGARYVAGTEIEVVREVGRPAIGHAIFDHDGTLSTLREGWEKIMEPMMVRAILGEKYASAEEGLYHRVVDAARKMIEKTTGIQTLAQMQSLVELVRQFGCVPAAEILDIHGYKTLYNEALLAMVRGRMAKLERGELAPEDFHIKGALGLLKRLHGAGVKLYLASGTDVEDVVAEARAMGYAELFEGRIFGAVGDVKVEAKREVLARIIRENGLDGSELVTFGDGPVEIRETRKRDGVAVGVASDEVRRFGMNLSKRARLIRAGADVIVADFSQLDSLMTVLGVARGD